MLNITLLFFELERILNGNKTLKSIAKLSINNAPNRNL